MGRLRGGVVLHRPPPPRRPLRGGEKTLARHGVVDRGKGKIGFPAVKPGDEGFVLTDIRFSHEYVTPMAAIFFEQLVGKDAKVNDPGSILMFRDHLTFLPEAMTPERIKEGLLDVALQLEKKQREFATAQGIKLYGELRLGVHGSEAICHSKILESHALPGQVIDRKSTRLNSSHGYISYAVFCLKKKTICHELSVETTRNRRASGAGVATS